VSGQQHALAALYPREKPGTHFTGGWVGPRAGLDGWKISSLPGLLLSIILNNDHGTHQVMVSLVFYVPTDPVSTKIIIKAGIMVEVNECTYVGITINSDENTKKVSSR